MEEIWKDIKGYEGLYQISNLGRIRTVFRYKHVYNYKVQGLVTIPINQKILKIQKHCGYAGINLRKNGTDKLMLVHRLVAEAFIPDKSTFKSTPDEDRSSIDLNLLHINHKDENKLNNNVDNLEWCTIKYNNSYGTHNTRVSNSLCKKINQYTADGDFIKTWNSIKVASETLKINAGNITKCCKGVRNKAGDYVWKYADK